MSQKILSKIGLGFLALGLDFIALDVYLFVRFFICLLLFLIVVSSDIAKLDLWHGYFALGLDFLPLGLD